MDNSPKLDLSYIAPAQAQKHITVNENIRRLDSLIYLAVLNRYLTTPPQNPAQGECYIVGYGASDEWLHHAQAVAIYEAEGWVFLAPRDGWTAWIVDEKKLAVYDNTAWQLIEGDELKTGLSTSQIGINTDADTVNRLAVKSEAVLLSHDDVTPGTGDTRFIINKSDASHSASIVMQSGYAGRAELGVFEGDDLAIKVSADGTNWQSALHIDAQSGAVSMPHTPPVAPRFNLLQDGGRFAGSPETGTAFAPSFEAPDYILSANGSVFSEGPKFIYNNSDNGGAAGALSPEISAFIERLREPGFRRYGVEFFTTEITAGQGNDFASLSLFGNDHYLTLQNKFIPLPDTLTLNWHVYVKSGSLVVQDLASSQILRDGVPVTGNQYVDSANGWVQFTRLYSVNSKQFNGYDPVLHRLYAQAGTVFLFAAPIIVPGHIQVSQQELIGLLPSLNAWG